MDELWTYTAGLGFSLTQRDVQRLLKQGGLPDEFDHLTLIVNADEDSVYDGAVVVSRSVVSELISDEDFAEDYDDLEDVVCQHFETVALSFGMYWVEEKQLERAAELLGRKLKVKGQRAASFMVPSAVQGVMVSSGSL